MNLDLIGGLCKGKLHYHLSSTVDFVHKPTPYFAHSAHVISVHNSKSTGNMLGWLAVSSTIEMVARLEKLPLSRI